MPNLKRTASLLICLLTTSLVIAQTPAVQNGIVFKTGTSLRLGNVMILNKRTALQSRSSLYGVFAIASSPGDTLEFKSPDYQITDFVVKDHTDQVIFMEPVTQLREVTVTQTSLKTDIREAQQGYRRKSVFYTGTPHYYYLFLKPMTFIYENFKSEVIQARRFNRYARKELAASEVTARFNATSIKNAINIPDNLIEDFEIVYMPSVQQIRAMSDYDLTLYIRTAYADFNKSTDVLNKTTLQ